MALMGVAWCLLAAPSLYWLGLEEWVGTDGGGGEDEDLGEGVVRQERSGLGRSL